MEAFGLLFGAVPTGITVLLNAVCHRLQPWHVGSVALIARCPLQIHIHIHIHIHGHVIAFGKCGAREVEG